jgi:hypothetical protein
MIPARTEAIIPVLAPFAPLFSECAWQRAQALLLGGILTSGTRTVTGTLRLMGLAMKRHGITWP